MEVITLRHATMKKALKTLGNGLRELEALKASKLSDCTLMRDGVIQRFEYCMDSFWKFLKIYLEINRKMTIESASPRFILKLSLSVQMLSEEECMLLLDGISNRNLTSHSYNEETAEKIQSQIPLYYITMNTIIDRLKP